jgi:hypothetical protein
MVNHSIEELDALGVELKKLHDEYKERKKLSDEAWRHYDDAKYKLLEAMREADKDSWRIKNLGNYIKIEKLKVRVPQDLSKKKEMLKWLKGLGPEEYVSAVTVNYNTLNAIYNEEVSKDANFRMPGVGEAVIDTSLTFRKD